MTQPQYRLWNELKKQEFERKMSLQEKLCIERNLPCFIRDCQVCPNCKNEILFYIKEEEAEKKHITACPICHFSLCE